MSGSRPVPAPVPVPFSFKLPFSFPFSPALAAIYGADVDSGEAGEGGEEDAEDAPGPTPIPPLLITISTTSSNTLSLNLSRINKLTADVLLRCVSAQLSAIFKRWGSGAGVRRSLGAWVAVVASHDLVVEFACEEVEEEGDQGVEVDVEADVEGEEEQAGEEETPQALLLASDARAVTCKTTALIPFLHLSFSFLACSASFSVRANSFASFSVRGWAGSLDGAADADGPDDEWDEAGDGDEEDEEDEEDPSDSCGKKHLPTFCGPNSQTSVFKPLNSSSLTVTSLLTPMNDPAGALRLYVDSPEQCGRVGVGVGRGGGET